jgi:hypothetical protein
MSTHKRLDCGFLFSITHPFMALSCHIFFFSLLGSFFWGKERKAQGLAFGFNFNTFTDTFRSSSILSLIRPCLPCSKKELARFHNSLKCLNACISLKTGRYL